MASALAGTARILVLDAMTDKYSTLFKNQGDCVSYYATGEKNLAN